MNSKVFSERFNKELSYLSFPDRLSEKAAAVAKVFGIKPFKANAIILGDASPSEDELTKIAEILEVCPNWLCGKKDSKKSN